MSLCTMGFTPSSSSACRLTVRAASSSSINFSQFNVQNRHLTTISPNYKAQIWNLRSADDVLTFLVERKSYDLYTKAMILKQFAQSFDARSNMDDPRLPPLLRDLEERVRDMKTMELAMTLDAVERLRNQDLSYNLLEALQREIVTRDEISPQETASLCLSFSALRIWSPKVIEFCKSHAMKNLEFANPGQMTAFLEGFRRFGIYDRVFVDMVVTKMLDDIEEFTPRDIGTCIATMARLGLSRGFLIRRLMTHAYDNLQLFTTKQTIQLLYGLSKLRFLSNAEIWDLISKIQEDLEKVSGTYAGDIVYALSMLSFKQELEFIVSMLQRGLHHTDKMLIGGRIDLALALIYYIPILKSNPVNANVVNTLIAEMPTLLESIWTESPPLNKPTLIKAYELGLAMEDFVPNHLSQYEENFECRAPESWRAASKEADMIEQKKIENSSRLHEEILLRLQEISELKKTQLNVFIKTPENWDIAVDFYEPNYKLAINIDTLNRPTRRRIKELQLRQMGYHTISLNYWSWRKCGSEKGQIEFLQNECGPILKTQAKSGSEE